MSSTKLDTSKRIAFVGGGNMASAIIGGLVAGGYPASNIYVSEPWEEARTKVEASFKVKTTTDNVAAVSFDGDKAADLVVLAVKPQVIKKVAEGITEVVQKNKPVVVSIAAGITIPDLSRWLGGGNVPLVRVMPNTPALVSEGATGLYAVETVSEEQKALAFNVLAAVSKTNYWVDREELLDVVTGVSGSGPAYFFLMVEALAKAGQDLGLPADVALGLARQTCMGAGRMLVDTQEDPAELRRKVTSPNGTTHAAIESFLANGFTKICSDAVVAATKRGEELGKEMGKQVSGSCG
ncbi:pyrroline-5-carboxylate reductase [Ascodesmis nigricans]|uniref:Pyrroline-5-carboxylate reductase n=1 Tax=Ascodesmis nigricans TaxID=341454 RepID=A0A4V3SJS2_9PEZI|nr:pyrroline-5-carboxylate reductase [Ascodesmis nigricans]